MIRARVFKALISSIGNDKFLFFNGIDVSSYALASQNPWWIDPQEILKDDKIQNFRNSPVKWVPRLKYFFELEKDAIYTIRGPRQVGKTTLIKLFILDLIERKINERRVFYWTCDLIEGPQGLVDLITNYINPTREFTDERLYIFLDEVSSINDWQKGIKYLYDIGKLKNTTIILTGSHSLDIKRASERLPGRRGESKYTLDKILVPMKFSEYIESRDFGLNKMLRRLNILNIKRRKSLFEDLSKGIIPSELMELNFYSEKLSVLLDSYLLTGGIISAINDYVTSGKIADNTYSKYIQVTLGDITRWKKNEAYFSQIINRLINVMGTPVSWRTLIKETDISHFNTGSEYVDILQSSFVLCTMYKLDRSKNGPNYKSEKKIYFLDPFIFHSLRSWVLQKPAYPEALKYLGSEKKSILIESILCDHLIRLSYNINPSDTFDPTKNVFYWKTKKNEVDYILKYNDDYIPIEIKYQSTIKNEDYKGIYSFVSARSTFNGMILTKNKLGVENGITSIPVYLFLSII